MSPAHGGETSSTHLFPQPPASWYGSVPDGEGDLCCDAVEADEALCDDDCSSPADGLIRLQKCIQQLGSLQEDELHCNAANADDMPCGGSSPADCLIRLQKCTRQLGSQQEVTGQTCAVNDWDCYSNSPIDLCLTFKKRAASWSDSLLDGASATAPEMTAQPCMGSPLDTLLLKARRHVDGHSNVDLQTCQWNAAEANEVEADDVSCDGGCSSPADGLIRLQKCSRQLGFLQEEDISGATAHCNSPMDQFMMFKKLIRQAQAGENQGQVSSPVDSLVCRARRLHHFVGHE